MGEREKKDREMVDFLPIIREWVSWFCVGFCPVIHPEPFLTNGFLGIIPQRRLEGNLYQVGYQSTKDIGMHEIAKWAINVGTAHNASLSKSGCWIRFFVKIFRKKICEFNAILQNVGFCKNQNICEVHQLFYVTTFVIVFFVKII